MCITLFSSCSNEISIKQTYLSNQGYNRPLTDSIRELAKNGYVHIDSTIDGNPLIQTVLVKVEPTFSQKYKIAQHDHTIIWFYILVGLSAGFILYGIIYSSNGGRVDYVAAVLFCVAILILAGAYATINWASTKEIEMSKMLFDFLKNSPGDQLKQYVDKNLFN